MEIFKISILILAGLITCWEARDAFEVVDIPIRRREAVARRVGGAPENL